MCSTGTRILPAEGVNGTYNEELFTQEALRYASPRSVPADLKVVRTEASTILRLSFGRGRQTFSPKRVVRNGR